MHYYCGIENTMFAKELLPFHRLRTIKSVKELGGYTVEHIDSRKAL
jgi:hypothetical protein